MAGWRIGYCVGNSEIIEGLGKIKGYFDYGIFSAIQIAGIIALRDCDDTIPEQVALYQARRDTLCNGLERIGWQVDKPGAGMFAWGSGHGGAHSPHKGPASFVRMFRNVERLG